MYDQQYNWGPQTQQKKGPLGGGSGDFLQSNMAKAGKKNGGNANISKSHFENDKGNPMMESMVGKMAGQIHPVLGMLAGPYFASRRKAKEWVVPNVPLKTVDGGSMQASTEPLQVPRPQMANGPLQSNPYRAASSPMSEQQRQMLMGGGFNV